MTIGSADERDITGFMAGAGVLIVFVAAVRIPAIAALSLVSLAALGAFGGHLGSAPLGGAALAAIGRIVGVAIG